jgi:hypothetical protein
VRQKLAGLVDGLMPHLIVEVVMHAQEVVFVGIAVVPQVLQQLDLVQALVEEVLVVLDDLQAHEHRLLQGPYHSTTIATSPRKTGFAVTSRPWRHDIKEVTPRTSSLMVARSRHWMAVLKTAVPR